MGIKLNEIADFVNGELVGNCEGIINSVSSLNNYKKNTLTFIKEPIVAAGFLENFSAIVLKGQQLFYPEANFIYVDNPRLSFFKVVRRFFSEEDIENFNCRFPFGTSVQVQSNTKIGKNVSIAPNSVIGSSGFGYVKDTDGSLFRIPHIGKVIIEDNVRIGACNCIDRGVIDDTVIGEGTKIDNACHLAHNCKIGKNCIITAGVTFSGSVTVGDGVWIGVGSTIKEGVKIGDRALIGSHSNVTKDVPVDTVVCGNPAKVLRKIRKGDVHVR